MRKPDIFNEGVEVKGEDVKPRVIVEGEGEKITLTEDECDFLKLEVLLGKRACHDIDMEREEELEIKESEMRMIYDGGAKSLNFAKRRVTDVKRNSRVVFPKKARSLEEEAAMQTLRMELLTLFRVYSDEKCGKHGTQKSNLTKQQKMGMKRIVKRVEDGELVVFPTDKSGNLALMTR